MHSVERVIERSKNRLSQLSYSSTILNVSLIAVDFSQRIKCKKILALAKLANVAKAIPFAPYHPSHKWDGNDIS